MKRLILTTLCAALVAGAFAQAAGHRGAVGGNEGGSQSSDLAADAIRNRAQAVLRIHQAVIRELQLDEQQTRKVQAAGQKRLEAQRKLREELGDDTQATRAKLQQETQRLQRQYMADLKEAMGERKFAQYEKRTKEELDKWQEEQRKRRRDGRTPPPN